MWPIRFVINRIPDVPLTLHLEYMVGMLSSSCPLLLEYLLSLLARSNVFPWSTNTRGRSWSCSIACSHSYRRAKIASVHAFPSWIQTGRHWDVLFLLECTAQGSLHAIYLHGWAVICLCRYCNLSCSPSSILAPLLYFASSLLFFSPPKFSERWW